MHGKTSKIFHKKIGIFKNIKSNLIGTRYHSLIIDRKSLSKDLLVTAETSDKIIMGRSLIKGNVEENLIKVSNSIKT